MTAKEMLEKVQELKEQTIFNGFTKPVDADKFWNENWILILDILDDALYDFIRHPKQPSAEPEIIRCKDCKWFGDIGCAIMIVDDSDKPTENDFCSFAERRTDEL